MSPERIDACRRLPVLVGLVALLSGCAGGDPAVRPNHLVLNEDLVLAAGASGSWPLYLTRRGDYYAEVTLT
ncbi:MAG: hypothetical protein RLW62_23030, partial [Gammaproteobacteria bacterium]